ncbi:hypothetical protein EDC01DRAFT_661060 [Geopyxis carbonaria]|nr:hypothetical protein EDC01DRAFT_661060 [Geopyxis carbonaria]
MFVYNPVSNGDRYLPTGPFSHRPSMSKTHDRVHIRVRRRSDGLASPQGRHAYPHASHAPHRIHQTRLGVPSGWQYLDPPPPHRIPQFIVFASSLLPRCCRSGTTDLRFAARIKTPRTPFGVLFSGHTIRTYVHAPSIHTSLAASVPSPFAVDSTGACCVVGGREDGSHSPSSARPRAHVVLGLVRALPRIHHTRRPSPARPSQPLQLPCAAMLPCCHALRKAVLPFSGGSGACCLAGVGARVRLCVFAEGVRGVSRSGGGGGEKRWW